MTQTLQSTTAKNPYHRLPIPSKCYSHQHVFAILIRLLLILVFHHRSITPANLLTTENKITFSCRRISFGLTGRRRTTRLKVDLLSSRSKRYSTN